MISADVGVSTPLELMLFDGATTKGVRVKIRTTSGTLLHTANLTHIGDGLYTGSWTPSAAGYFHATYTVYTDGTYATEDVLYSKNTEVYRVTYPGGIDPAVISGAVWNALLTSYHAAGTFGEIIQNIWNYQVDLTHLLRDDDPRLDYLDAYISSRATPEDITNACSALREEMIANFNDCKNKLTNILTKVLLIKAKTDNLPADPASESTVVNGVNTIRADLTIIDNRTLAIEAATARIETAIEDAEAAILEAIAQIDLGEAANLVQYINRMTTTFNPGTGIQEVIVWSEKNGQQITDVRDCDIKIKDSLGVVKWEQSSSIPNADGVFRFISPIVLSSDSNYYIIMSVKVSGVTRVTQQAFITIG